MSKYFNGELLSAYEDLNKEFECKKENLKLHEQIADLEAKLAEKDELIGILKNKYECADRELYLTKDTLKHHTNIYNSLVESKDQDKISFAVERMEKVKRHIIENTIWELTYDEALEIIDNQIKQLKEMK